MKNYQRKNTAHNLVEVKVLIKEAFGRGDEERFNDMIWYSHTGEELCKSFINLVDFTLDLPDRSSLIVEVL